MNIAVLPLSKSDRKEWEKLYHAYADFYSMPMNEAILDRVWSWIFDQNNAFYCLIAKDESGEALGLMHYREMPSQRRAKRAIDCPPAPPETQYSRPLFCDFQDL